jgi:hypothetical protein
MNRVKVSSTFRLSYEKMNGLLHALAALSVGKDPRLSTGQEATDPIIGMDKMAAKGKRYYPGTALENLRKTAINSSKNNR